MSDTGNSVGAVLLEFAARAPELLRGWPALEHVYWGPQYSREEIAAELAKAGLAQNPLAEPALVDAAARAIHDGKVVGWFQGRMEFGPRALGNRSMLARPTDASINDWLNQRLDRSEFMPFAPSVLAEHADALFEGVAKARHTAEFMTITFDVRPEWRCAHSGGRARGRHGAAAAGARRDQSALSQADQRLSRALRHSAGAQHQLQRARRTHRLRARRSGARLRRAACRLPRHRTVLAGGRGKLGRHSSHLRPTTITRRCWSCSAARPRAASSTCRPVRARSRRNWSSSAMATSIAWTSTPRLSCCATRRCISRSTM